MFELGSSLREARLRRGLDLDEAAERTLIRARYLAALEEERFHVLPHGSYRRSFLREYAEFLGLDGDIYVDEYIARHEPAEETPALVPPRIGRRGPAPAVVKVAVILAVAAAFAVAVWGLGGSEPKRTGLPQPRVTPKPGVHRPPTRTQPKPVAARPPSARPHAVTFLAARGRCWLSVRVGASDGPVVFERTLEQGEKARFGLKRPLWIRLGAPQNVDATLGKKTVTNLPTHVASVRVSASGIETV